jgi:hypothetical protein
MGKLQRKDDNQCESSIPGRSPTWVASAHPQASIAVSTSGIRSWEENLPLEPVDDAIVSCHHAVLQSD